MVTLKINNNVFFFNKNVSVLEACRLVGIHLPRFCYHEILSVVGNCRMCLVEIEKSPKPVVSCAMPVSNNLNITTNSPLIKKSRENILELLLLNHPLDCPICDQGGECDLQDQVRLEGLKISRSFVSKRGVEDKKYGVFIKTIMTRCIHCTRCVRFSDEIAGILGFGTFNRGNFMEIGSYTKSYFNSEISGNVIDLCPVGALTSKPYAFKTRSWELKVDETIDCTDNFGSNILVNYKDSEILRIQPKINKHINQTLITDRIRFCYDALHSNRISSLVKKSDVVLIKADIIFFFEKISDNSNSFLESKVYRLNNFCMETEWKVLDLENLILLNNNKTIKNLFVSYLIKLNVLDEKYLNLSDFIVFTKFQLKSVSPVYIKDSIQSLKKYIDVIINTNRQITILVNDTLELNLGAQLLQLSFLHSNIQVCNISSFSKQENNFLFKGLHNNSQYSVFLKNSNFKVCFLLSIDLKLESTLLNVKIRNRVQHNNLKIFSLGHKTNNLLNTFYVNLSLKSIFNLFEGKSLHSFCLSKNCYPLIVIGNSIKTRGNWKKINYNFLKYCPTGFFLNMSGFSNTIGAEYLNFPSLTTYIKDKTEIFFCLNLEDNIFIRKFLLELNDTKDYLWFNTHMSLVAKKKALFIGSFSSFLESENFYINFDNIIQKTQNIFKSKQTIKFFDTFFSHEFSKVLGFCSLLQKETFFSFYKESLNQVSEKLSVSFNFSVNLISKKMFSFNSNYPLKSSLEDFFLKDNFTKNSKNLLLRSQEIRKNYIFFNK